MSIETDGPLPPLYENLLDQMRCRMAAAEGKVALIRAETIEECAIVAEIALAKTAADDIRKLK